MTVFYVFLGLIGIVFIIEVVWACLDRMKGVSHSNKWIASPKILPQVFGALIQWRPKYFWTFVLLVIPLSLGVSLVIAPGNYAQCLYLIGLNLMVWLTIKVCRRLVDIFSLRKQETSITWCYISILMAMVLWLVSFLLIFNIKNEGKIMAALGLIGTMLGWIFQDKIKGVVAFIHLRMHHLLNIGDRIQVPSKGVDGEVKKVTLTSVTISNWDTTTSIIPISCLHADHFINLQNMMAGKTHGQRMYKSFFIDTESFCHLTNERIKEIEKEHGIRFFSDNEKQDGMLNAGAYRLYLFHYLMNHPHVSQQPRLIVRWMEQQEGGMPLQVYAYIMDTSLASFEWQQSEIIEHIIESLGWFGLRLYQRTSSYDIKLRVNGNEN